MVWRGGLYCSNRQGEKQREWKEKIKEEIERHEREGGNIK